MISDITYNLLLEFVEETEIPIIVVPGNHERSILPYSLLTQHKDIHIFTQPDNYIFEIPSNNKREKKIVKISISAFPNIRENLREKFNDIIHKEIIPIEKLNSPKSDCDIKLLCMHQAIENSKVYNYTFKYGYDVVKLKDLENLDYNCILSGHIHKYQVYNVKANDKSSTPIIYSGSTQRTSFQEMQEEKGFCILNFEEGISSNKTVLKNIDFIILNTRKMIIINISNNDLEDIRTSDTIEKKLELILKNRINNLPKDCIIKLKVEDQNLKKYLTAKLIISVFPKTMNVDFSSNFRRL